MSYELRPGHVAGTDRPTRKISFVSERGTTVGGARFSVGEAPAIVWAANPPTPQQQRVLRIATLAYDVFRKAVNN